jgi:hypothetical protein
MKMTGIRKQLVLMALLSVLTLCRSIALGQGTGECSKYWGAKAVFIGKIARTYRGISKASQYLNGVEQVSNTTVLHITFKEERSFTGLKTRKAGALVEVECADCVNDNDLLQGERYLVYARGVGSKGGYPLATGLPALVSKVPAEIAYLEKLTARGTIADSLNRVITGALLGGRATSMPRPAYPEIAKAARASGAVTVAIILNRSGRVIRAEAVCGHPLLRATSAAAAMKIRYMPTKVNGRAIPVGGLVTYNFVSQ